jgi:hypothetical protein
MSGKSRVLKLMALQEKARIAGTLADMREVVRQPDEAERMVERLREALAREGGAPGVRLATEVLHTTGWDAAMIAQVCEIIDGHDTRETPRHLNDRIVRDSDKLWRYEVTGTAVGCDWFGETPAQNCVRNEKILAKFETEPGRAMASAALAETRKALKIHVL